MNDTIRMFTQLDYNYNLILFTILQNLAGFFCNFEI